MKKITLIEKAYLLKNTSLFSQLDLDVLLPIADKLVEQRYQKGESIFSFSGQASKVFLLQSGEVEVLNEEDETLTKILAGDFFGEEALLSESNRKYTARCFTDVKVLSLNYSHLLTILTECPGIALNLIRSFAQFVPFRSR